MKVTEHVSIHGLRTAIQIEKHDDYLSLSIPEARALALALARACTKPHGLVGEGVDNLREMARELDVEADRRAERAGTKAVDA